MSLVIIEINNSDLFQKFVVIISLHITSPLSASTPCILIWQSWISNPKIRILPKFGNLSSETSISGLQKSTRFNFAGWNSMDRITMSSLKSLLIIKLLNYNYFSKIWFYLWILLLYKLCDNNSFFIRKTNLILSR